MKNIIKNILTLIVSTLTIFIIVEIALMIFSPQIHEHDILFQTDSQLGWTFIPEKTGAIVYPGETNKYIQINDSGFRDHDDFINTEKTKKVMVIGDSFVSNVAVQDDEVFTEVMESQWEDVTVMNFGVNGYGQVQEYLLLEQWLPKVQPDLVIQLIYLRNDFRDNVYNDNWLYTKPSAVLNGEGDVSIQEIPEDTPIKRKSKPRQTGFKKMHLYHFIKNRLQNVEVNINKTNSKYRPPEIDLCNPFMDDKIENQYAILQALLLKTKQYLDTSGIPIVFVLAPSIAQVRDEQWTAIENYDKGIKLQRDLPNNMLLEFATRNELLMLDLLPELQKQSGTGNTLYNTYEQHWTAQGNKIVAASIIDFLETNRMLKW